MTFPNKPQSDYYWDVESQQYLPSAKSGGLETSSALTWTSSVSVHCPDLLRLSDLGEADSWRGHVVRGFFRALSWVTGV